ncbi:MAG: C39 family peptidase [Lachnospiraceae bacterium]|nr:C39 family peptidase [Lachnospiraceae bacterium]
MQVQSGEIQLTAVNGQRTSIREKRRRQRRRRRNIAIVKLTVLAVLAVCAVRLLWHVGAMNLGDMRWEDYRADGYVKEEDAHLEEPVKRDESDIEKKIRKLAKKDSAYQAIYDNYDAYPEELLGMLCNNPDMLSFVQGYPDAKPEATGGFEKEELSAAFPLLIQWDKRWGYAPYGGSDIAISGCAPTCLSMVTLALTGNQEATPDKVAAYAEEAGYYLEGTGTAWSLMTEGCTHFGVCGTEISLDESVIRQHLQNGEPIICSVGPGDFTTQGHFIVLVGEEDGRLVIHDPNSKERSKVLWSYDTVLPQIKNLWAFTK